MSYSRLYTRSVCLSTLRHIMENSAWLEALLNKYSSDNTIRRILNIEINDAVPKGDNYLSEIKRATVTVIYNNGFQGKETFIYKLQNNASEVQKSLEEFSVFKAEINIYEHVLKNFSQLMNEYQDGSDKLWCNMIGYKPYSLIVFEDLKAQNFKAPTRQNLLDLNHGLLVMHGLGRMHALGAVLVAKGLACKGDFIEHYLEIESPATHHLVAGGLKLLSEVMLKEWPEEWYETALRVAKQEKIAVKKIQKLMKMNNDCFQTICHGDVWTCNLLFKYCPYNETLPVALKFVDFQNTNMNSYVFDLLTFLYTSLQPEIRRQNLDELFEMYQKTLESTLAIYGMKDKAPKLEQIQAETKQAEYFSLIMSLIFLALVCADCDSPYNLEAINFDYNVRNAYNPKIFSNPKFIDTVKDDLKLWMERNIL